MYSWLAVLSFAHLAFTGVQGQEYTDVTTPSGGSITIANYQQINTVRLAANIAGCKAACSDPDLNCIFTTFIQGGCYFFTDGATSSSFDSRYQFTFKLDDDPRTLNGRQGACSAAAGDRWTTALVPGTTNNYLVTCSCGTGRSPVTTNACAAMLPSMRARLRQRAMIEPAKRNVDELHDATVQW